MDAACIRSVVPTLLLAVTMTVVVAATGASAQTPADQSKKADQINQKNPAAPTANMESPELPKKPDGKGGPKADFGKPQPPEQPYPTKAKE